MVLDNCDRATGRVVCLLIRGMRNQRFSLFSLDVRGFFCLHTVMLFEFGPGSYFLFPIDQIQLIIYSHHIMIIYAPRVDCVVLDGLFGSSKLFFSEDFVLYVSIQ